jgi:hypothetical protein
MRRPLIAAFLIALSLACRMGSGGTAGPATVLAPQTGASAPVALPNRDGSLKFAVLGDFGNGSRQQYELGTQMAKLRDRFPFELVLTVGDNIYGADTPQSFRERFEQPYKALLDEGVKFYASLGNHDSREQRFYKLFNMEGQTYYTFKAPRQDVRFFALESDYLDLDQIAWLEKELQSSGEAWKIPYFHHPLYSSGARHGSQLDLRRILEPLFIKHNVSVVLTGHDHFYERIKPQNGIVYFVVGSGGQLRRNNINSRTGLTAKGFDTDQVFLAAEIDGDEMFFNALSRTGEIVDSGIILRREQSQD